MQKTVSSTVARLSIPALCAVLLLNAGCAALGYRVGSTLPPGIAVVHVPSFTNQSGEPLLELGATQATIAQIQRDGTLSIGDLDKADVVLQVVLTDFSLTPLRYDSDTATTTSEYRMTILADVKLVRQRDNAVMASSKVKGETDFQPVGDLSSAKRDAMPQAEADLAHQIVKSVVEFW
jgi:hypothetical protein